MSAFIEPPTRIPWLLKLGMTVSRKITGKDLLIAKLLSWYPKAAVGSGLLESLVAHHDKNISDKILKLVRIQASFSAACPFCIDMNAFEYEKYGISDEEFAALKNQLDLSAVSSFTIREKLAIEYSRLISQTPLTFPPELIDQIKAVYKEREMVILASTAAQVNYWARLNSALGVPPAGFRETCDLADHQKS